MKHLASLGLLLAISTVALANPNNPANRCKRYAHANAFQSTVAQLCGGNGQSVFQQVIQDQACQTTLGEEELNYQSDAQANELRAEYNRTGASAFCAKYANRQ